MEICRHLPACLVPYVVRARKSLEHSLLTLLSLAAPAIMGWSGAMKKVASFLTPLVEDHLRQSNHGDIEQSVSIATRARGRGCAAHFCLDHSCRT